jgi:4-diphosphocytidyl-2-C-methyl-D-erythritol kinase
MGSAISKTVAVRSFAKINLGLYIGAPRADGFHDLRTVYQTIALHDVVRISVGRGSGIEILCTNHDPRVPLDASNTCWRMAELVMSEVGASGRVRIEIDKRLPVQGGLGAASSNAVATMIALERTLKRRLPGATRLRIAAEVGSDLPLFVVGGASLGVGRGEEVYPLADFPSVPVVLVMPEVGVSTARAFADWDALVKGGAALGADGQTRASAPTQAWTGQSRVTTRSSISVRNSVTEENRQLTPLGASDRLFEVGCALSAWLTGFTDSYPNTGASAKGGSRAGKLLSDLVRTGIENDFEKVVFSQYPELRDIKGALERAGAKYASLSGSGSTLYGLFRTRDEARRAARRLERQGVTAVATSTLTRAQYWKRSLVVGR